MAIAGVSAGDVFVSSGKYFLYAGDVSGNQVIVEVEHAPSSLDLFIVRPDNTPHWPTPADNGGDQFALNQDIYVSYPNGTREIYRYDGTYPQLIDRIGVEENQPTIWLATIANTSSWQDIHSPTDDELNFVYISVVPELKRAYNDVLLIEQTGASFMRFDTEDGTQNWLPSTIDQTGMDAQNYAINTVSYNRGVHPIPSELGLVQWKVGSRIDKVLPNGITEIFLCDSPSTNQLVRTDLPTEPFVDRPEPLGWKSGETFKYIWTDEGGNIRLQRYQWRAQAGTLVAYEVLSASD